MGKRHICWSLCTLHVLACQVTVAVGDLGLCCVRVRSFGALINSLVCWFLASALGLVLFPTKITRNHVYYRYWTYTMKTPRGRNVHHPLQMPWNFDRVELIVGGSTVQLQFSYRLKTTSWACALWLNTWIFAVCKHVINLPSPAGRLYASCDRMEHTPFVMWQAYIHRYTVLKM